MESGTQSERQTDYYVNRHRLCFVSPDIIRIWWNGNCSRDEIERIFDYGESCIGARQHFVLADFSRLTMVESDARRYAIVDLRVKRVVGIAMIGATFQMRVLMSMIVRAAEIIHKESRSKVRFFDTEGEAFDWIKQERERLGLALVESNKVHEV